MPGDTLKFGQRFGLIKFGSRTELIIPKHAATELLVRVGDRVRAGLTPMVRMPVQPTKTPRPQQHPHNMRKPPRTA